MMKKILPIFAFIMLNLSINAQAKNYDIAVVDIQLVLQDSSAAKDIRAQIKAKRDAYQAEITQQEDRLRKSEQKLSEQRSILSPEAFTQKREEFKEQLVRVQRDVQIKRSDLDKILSDSLAQVQQVVFDVIKELADEKGFKVAIPTSQILFAENSLNITAEVLRRLNKRLPKIN